MFNAWYDASPECRQRRCKIQSMDASLNGDPLRRQVEVHHKDGKTGKTDTLCVEQERLDDVAFDVWGEQLFPWIRSIHEADKKAIGLMHKYDVQRTDGRPVGWCFVLEDTDPLSIPALQSYSIVARANGYGALADDLDAKVKELYARHYR